MNGELLNHIISKARSWCPRFVLVDTVEECACYINLPHEDYPLRVDRTKEMIDLFVSDIKERGSGKFDECYLKNIHSYVMFGLGSRGAYRSVNVRVGSYRPPEHIFVKELMQKILPIKLVDHQLPEHEKHNSLNVIANDRDLTRWYSLFETIHPFEDGNGRVGGIVAGAISYSRYGEYLAPLQ